MDPASTTPEAAPEATPASDPKPESKPTGGKPPEAPKPATTPDTEPKTIDELPEWAQKHVRELRTENGATRTKLKEYEDRDKTEAERLASRAEEAEKRAAAAEAASARLTAANKFGVPAELVSLIHGTTVEEAEAQAQLLAQHAGGPAGGNFPPVPHGTQQPPPPKDLASQIREAEKSGDWQAAGRLKAQQLADLSKQ